MVPGDAEILHDEVVIWPAPDAEHPDGRPHHGRGPAVDAHAPAAQSGAVPLRGAGPGHGTEHDRPVGRITEAQDAVRTDLDPRYLTGSHEGPVGAAEVLENPGVPVQLQDRMVPGHP